jgi:release factor glutamine methyltransferase
MKNSTNVIAAQHPNRIVYVTEAYDFNGDAVPGLCGSTLSLEKMLYHLKTINFPFEQRFISQVPKIDDPRAKVLRELTEEEKTYLGQFFGTTLTDRLLEYTFKHREPYDINVGDLTLTCFPDVFPPASPFSYDSIPLAEMNDAQKRESVLDIGTGTGIHAVKSAMNGARKVIATDVSEQAVKNCEYNAQRYGLEKVIHARHGNLFNPIRWHERIKKFDLIIANLPFVNHPVSEDCERWVYDENHQAHKEFFANAGKYLKKNGRILISFSNIGDVDFFESQIKKNGFSVKDKRSDENVGKEWYVYRLTKE